MYKRVGIIILSILFLYLATSYTILEVGNRYQNKSMLNEAKGYYEFASRMLFFSQIPQRQIESVEKEIENRSNSEREVEQVNDISEDVEQTNQNEVENTVVPEERIEIVATTPKYNTERCINQKKSVVNKLDEEYIELYENRQEERKDFIGDCYEEKSVPECDNKMSEFNVETVELQRKLVNSYKSQLTECSSELRHFGDVSEVVPEYF